MSHIFRTINRYHDQFESYKRVISASSPIFWLSILSVVMFIYSIMWAFNIDIWPYLSIDQRKKIFPVMGFEIMVILLWSALQTKRDRLVVEDTKKLLKTNEEKITNLKRMWLEKTLNISRHDFLALATDIDNALILRERNKSTLSLDGKKLSRFIFAAESKNRILGMFMGMSAAVIGLSISAGASLDDVFRFFEEESLQYLFFSVGAISFLIMLTYLVFWYIALILGSLSSMAFERCGGHNSISNRRARTFINELVILHELPKGRIRADD